MNVLIACEESQRVCVAFRESNGGAMGGNAMTNFEKIKNMEV